jgi:transposase
MVLERILLPVQLNRLIGHTARYYQNSSSVRFVYEAGFSGFYLYRQLTKAGYDCMITPPNRVPSLSDKVKTDKRDALKLAQMYAAGLLKEVFVPPLSVESDRQVLRLRNNYQKKITRVKIQINSHLYLNGHFWSKEMGNRWTKKYIAWLEGLEFQEPYLRFILEEYLTEYHFYRRQIAELTRHIREISRKDTYRVHFKRLVACKGIGLITAMTFLLELWDLTRFSSAGEFSSYLGLTPSQHSSGQHVRLGHITREGNAHIRRVLVESAWTVIRHDPFLKEKYDRIRAKGTNGKKAIVAVARSLAIRLRRCLLDETPYQIGVF